MQSVNSSTLIVLTGGAEVFSEYRVLAPLSGTMIENIGRKKHRLRNGSRHKTLHDAVAAKHIRL